MADNGRDKQGIRGEKSVEHLKTEAALVVVPMSDVFSHPRPFLILAETTPTFHLKMAQDRQ